MIAEHRSTTEPTDWESIQQRLSDLQESMRTSHALSSEREKALMDERAQTLARTPDAEPDSSRILELISFSLADERFAIETRFVREVYRPGPITPLPHCPDFFVGVTNLRGNVLGLVNLQELFNLEAGAELDTSQVLIVGEEKPEFGVITDGVQEVFTLRMEEICEPPGTTHRIVARNLRGVTKDALLVLDGNALLTDERLCIEEGDTP